MNNVSEWLDRELEYELKDSISDYYALFTSKDDQHNAITQIAIISSEIKNRMDGEQQ